MPRKQSSRGLTIRGKAQLAGTLTNTSAGGAFVLTRFEVDTTLCTSWLQLGQSFAKWKLKSLTFHFTTLKATTVEGTAGICFLTDPLETSPTSASSAMNMQYSRMGNIHQNISLRVKPVNKWFFTRDIAATTDDRLEMPGDVVYFTENTTAAYTPGLPWVSYVVEFSSVTNAVVTPLFKTLEEKRNSMKMETKLLTTGDNVNTSQNSSGIEEKQQEQAILVAKLESELANLVKQISLMKTSISSVKDQ